MTANKAQAYMGRSAVMENRALIQKNYDAAFLGNRQLANQNTEDIFRNRGAIMNAIKVDSSNQTQTNFKEAQKNLAKIEFLEHRSSLNSKVLDITLRMAAINAELIRINEDVLAANEEIVQYNAAKIAENAEALKSGVDATKATPESNAALVASNAARITAIRDRAGSNADKITEVVTAAEANRKKISANTDIIFERRARIQANAGNIKANQEAVARFVGEV